MSIVPRKASVADKHEDTAGGRMDPESRGGPFRYDPWNPDFMQARGTAGQWRGNKCEERAFLLCASGCTIAGEEQREALLQEIERDMKVVEGSAEYFAPDELDKLRNLKGFVLTAVLAGQYDPEGGDGEKEGRKRLDIELIY